jgi:hypothetical protein
LVAGFAQAADTAIPESSSRQEGSRLMAEKVSNRFVAALLGVFSAMFAAGYWAGMKDQNVMDMVLLFNRVVVAPQGDGVLLRYSCAESEDHSAGVFVEFDPGTDSISIPLDVQAAVSAESPGRQRFYIDKDVADALLGGASIGITLDKLVKIAASRSRGVTFWERAEFQARRGGRLVMLLVATVSGYEVGYYFGNRHDLKCEAPQVMAQLKTLQFWRNQAHRYAIVNLAWLSHSLESCHSPRLTKLLSRAKTPNFQPTSADLSFIEGATTEEVCAKNARDPSSSALLGITSPRPDLVVPSGSCRGSVGPYDSCEILNESLPPDIAAWKASIKACDAYLDRFSNSPDNGTREQCAISMRALAEIACGKKNPRYQSLLKRYEGDAALLSTINTIDTSEGAIEKRCKPSS